MKEITPRDWDGWPTQGQLLQLSTKADGLFHYATTALQWINEQIRKRGKACQKEVFEKFAQLGIGQLQDLYRLILTSFENIDSLAQGADWRARQLRGFQHVIGTIVVLEKPLTTSQILALLGDIPEDNFDVKNFLQQMHSVLIPGTTTSFEKATPQMHKSFRDYIVDGHAPAEFRIFMGHAHFVTARSCLEVIVNARGQRSINTEYSLQHWNQHLRQADERIWKDERMWKLFGQMAEEAVVDMWKANSWQVFLDVAAVGWRLLKQGTDKHRMEGISSILMKAKSELFLLSIVIQIVRHPISLLCANFFWLQPYQHIWDHGLLQTRHQG
ncbi:hypothetical protein B0H14DRAFT_3603031 [Mycena olivaceomarginata]|nr:hypothetical protein B0H14DRAFT_3603031 [Mycena olivaceomarginata]